MAQSAQCPSCGAPVEFKSSASILAVCDYCQSTLLRRGAALDDLGKMAALLPDRSPLQRGAQGTWRGKRFSLIGRLQLEWAQGRWNEWHLLFDDGASGWLSESGGEYVLSLPQTVREALPAFENIEVGEIVSVNGRSYTVTNKLAARCVAGEGELPFKVGAGYPAPVVDLRDTQGGPESFVTLDYSDDPLRPLVFVGERVDFKRLDWRNLRERPPAPAVAARAFNCPNCGAPLQVKHADIVTVGCTGCGALLDAASDEVKLIAAVSRALAAPRLPLGSRGVLRGEALEVVGFMRRCMKAEGIDYCWGEYVCLGPDNALVWLTEYDGHWNLARVLTQSVAARADRAIVGREVFRHFQDYEARVDVVLGEFPWQVRIDERAQVSDYIAPPWMLSRERTAEEVTWTRAEYVEPAEIAAAFKLATPLPAPRGVFANQPNPREASHRRVCKLFWRFALAALLIHLVLLVAGPGGTLVRQTLSFSPEDDEPQLLPAFRLEAKTPLLEVASSTNLANNWIGLQLVLANEETGESWQVVRELQRYEGVEDGEHWAEGSREDAIVFTDLPPGEYRLAIEAELDPASPPVQVETRVSIPGSRTSSLILVWLFLALFPLFSRYRQWNFEVARWAESDHPIVTESEEEE
ncbi:MAG: DUF4178 domain-containing protein [Rhodocyclaceae bacterium]|nr:DUF4178 domain-containing protein [Rhodocyclaceae bacterium]